MLINENDKNTFDKIWSDGYKKGHYDGSQWADRIRNEDISAGTACFLVRDKRLADSQSRIIFILSLRIMDLKSGLKDMLGMIK